MPDEISAPPPVIDHARLLCYAAPDPSAPYLGHTSLFVDGQELGRVPRLAICRDARLKALFLFHCDCNWDVLGCAEYPTIAAAKVRAERIYPGLSSRWVDANVTEEESERFLDALWADERCALCGKRGDYVEELREHPRGWACELCVG